MSERLKFKVMITKCSKNTLWYANEIDKIVDVYRSSYDWILCVDVDLKAPSCRHILLEDCQEVIYESVWFIEDLKTNEWYYGVSDLECNRIFGINPYKALQFCAKEDAWQAITDDWNLCELECIPTEHTFSSPKAKDNKDPF